jgi:hypothetical protein
MSAKILDNKTLQEMEIHIKDKYGVLFGQTQEFKEQNIKHERKIVELISKGPSTNHYGGISSTYGHNYTT